MATPAALAVPAEQISGTPSIAQLWPAGQFKQEDSPSDDAYSPLLQATQAVMLDELGLALEVPATQGVGASQSPAHHEPLVGVYEEGRETVRRREEKRL